ncbi:MAG: CHRD domain-containing protein [Planctomycetes bacterium]|nr:CHRD domain-containing protein [Planctomycetota bacterium]
MSHPHTHSRSRSPAVFAQMVMTLLPFATSQAGPIAGGKIEGVMKYGQNFVHGPLIGPADIHPLVPLPANFWDSPVTLTGTVGPLGDTLTAAHRARHKVAPHAGEAVPGPWWNAPIISPPPGFPFTVTFAGARGTRNHGHTDYFNHLIVALWGPGSRILGYAYASSAAHDPISCSSKSAVLTGYEANPPTPSHALGATSLVYDAGTNTFVVSVSIFGIERNNLLHAAIFAGGPGEEGPMIIDLGPPSQWTAYPNMGIGTVVNEAQFPPEYVPDLLAGRTYVVVRTMTYPSGEIRGQLIDTPMVCPGDLNGDGLVDLVDLTRLLSNFGRTGAATPSDGDLDGDTDVDLADLTNLLSNFGSICE